MESVKTTVSKNKVSSTLDLKDDLRGFTKAQKDELASQIGELLVTQIIESCADSKSPIDGSSFQKLSKDYASIKKAETGSSDPNLDLSGSMLGALDFKVQGNKLEIGVYGSEDAGKADGHNNFSGKSNLPTRQFLPGEGESFDKSILSLVDDAVANYKVDNLTLDTKVLNKIESSKDLYLYLEEVLGDYTRAELKMLVLGSEMAATLDEFDLLDFL